MARKIILTQDERDEMIKGITWDLSRLWDTILEPALTVFDKTIVRKLRYCWTLRARPDQCPPNVPWLIWLLLGGRGSGKTRAGAEWVRERVKNGARRIALVAPTYNEAREVMIEGESGLLNIGPPEERPVYLSSRKRLEWPNGTIGHVFSGEDPDGLRGPQFDTAWADEFCAWAHPEDTLANLRMGLRLTSKLGAPKLTVTTTPRPLAALRQLMKTAGLVISRARTRDNTNNLSPAFLNAIEETYGGTRLGRQELDGEILTDHPGALWTRAMIETACARPRDFVREDYAQVIVAIDPPISAGENADACGIIVAGLTRAGPGGLSKAIILHDGSLQGRSPEGWAARAGQLYAAYSADYVVAEVNQGGDMVKTVLRHASGDSPNPDQIMAVKTLYANGSKSARAIPVALLYEQARVEHAARFPELEDELCRVGADDVRGKSPDRADALVWAVTELLLTRRAVPRVRVL